MAWAVVLLCVVLLALAFWAIVAGDTESGMRDESLSAVPGSMTGDHIVIEIGPRSFESPTLDVQNHRGD